MAPKRAKVVRTTKKVVEETVEVLGVTCDIQDSVDLPAASNSKMVEVWVEAKEGEVPIAVVVAAKDKKAEPETEQKQRADEASPETEQPQHKRDGDAERVSEQREKEKKIECGTEQKKRANEASLETEESLPQQKGEENDHRKGKEAGESIADMETQEEEEEGGEEREEKGEEDERVEKEVEPPTPKKVEQRKEAPMKERKKGGKQRRRRKKRLAGGDLDGAGGGYKRYLFRVLRQVHPGLGISARAMAVVDGMVGDMFERLADEASRLSTYAGKATLSSREVQGAVQLVLPGELGKHAIAEGSKAVANYMAAASGGGD